MGTLDPFKNKSIHTKFVCKYDVCKKKPECLEKNIKQLIGTTFFAAKPRVIFTSSSWI